VIGRDKGDSLMPKISKIPVLPLTSYRGTH
jgi:hypothetical protein